MTSPQDPFAPQPPSGEQPTQAFGSPGGQQPAYGQQPPASGEQPPAYGSPQYGQSYGQPAYAQQQGQPYGQVPPGHGLDYGPQYGPPSTSTRAIVALVLAIGSFVVFPIIPAIIALVLAGGARQEIEMSQGRIGGAGLVTAARIVSWINIGLGIAAIVLIFLAFGLFASVGTSAG